MKHKREDMPLLGQKINYYRKKKKGYTIEKFAEDLGVCRATLQRYLVGKAIPLDKVNQIAYLLDISVQTLIDGTEISELTYETDDITRKDFENINVFFQAILDTSLLKEIGRYDLKDLAGHIDPEAYHDEIIISFANDLVQYFKALSVKYRAEHLYSNQSCVYDDDYDNPIYTTIKHLDSVMEAIRDNILGLEEELQKYIGES